MLILYEKKMGVCFPTTFKNRDKIFECFILYSCTKNNPNWKLRFQREKKLFYFCPKLPIPNSRMQLQISDFLSHFSIIPSNLTQWRLKIHNTRFSPQGGTNKFPSMYRHLSAKSVRHEPLLSSTVATFASSRVFPQPCGGCGSFF